METVTAAGADIPILGFGTFELRGNTARAMVRTALDQGYRHIDTAQIYGNEKEVGRGIAEAGVPRGDIFLTTKVWPDNYRSGDLERSVEQSLSDLGTDYIDLLLLHWPNPSVPLKETITALNRVRESGRTRYIGISNFNTTLMAEAVELSDAPIAANQIEYHPFLNQDAVLTAARRHGMAVTAYSPLARGKVFENDTLKDIATHHDKTPGQVTLRWLIQQDGVAAIPRSGKKEHAAANMDIFDFELSDADMAAIAALTAAETRLIDIPGLSPEWD